MGTDPRGARGAVLVEFALIALVFTLLLVATVEGRISLTPRGRLVADAIGAEILEAFESAAKVAGK